MFEILTVLNNNKILWGVTMLLLNVGSRYVVADLGKFHESILSNEYVKKIILFSMFFVATRDILTAFILTILYLFIVDGLLHEKRKFCIVPNKYKNLNNINKVNESQYLEAKQKILIYEQQNKELTNKDIKKPDIYEKYTSKVNILNM
jgi:hypothetical protein